MTSLSPRLLLTTALLLWGLLPCATTAAPQESAAPASEQKEELLSPTEETLARLTQLREQLLNNHAEMEALRKELTSAKNEERIAHIQQRLSELPKSIEALNRSFEQVALGGIDMAVLAEKGEEKFDWKTDLIEITRPLFASLKELTEKPRKIEQYRQLSDRSRQQLEVAERALASIEALRAAKPPRSVALKLKDLAENWQQRQHDLRAEQELAEYQISVLQGETGTTWHAIIQSIENFLRGRGLTLFIAAAALLLVWLLARLIRTLSHRLALAIDLRKGRRRLRKHAIRYIYRFLTGLAMVFTLLLVFYLRSDLLLLALTLIVVVMLALALRQALPKYIKEFYTLFDFGSVREGERVIYNGLPLRVGPINAFTALRNPELEGYLRLPIAQLTELVSRPADEEEWFPCRKGEFLLLANGTLAEVKRLTLEHVQLRTMQSMLQLPTSDLLTMEFRNLSRNGFALPITFGIDYRHQPSCLDEVPEKMHAAVEAALINSDWSEQFVELLVEFKEAGANSLDYIIYLSMGGAAAGHYYAIARLVQQTLVRLCNQEGWVIPFAQLTLHQGEGFDAQRSMP